MDKSCISKISKPKSKAQIGRALHKGGSNAERNRGLSPRFEPFFGQSPSNLSGLAAGRPVSVAERSHRCCSKAPETRPESRQAQQFESHVGGCELPSWNRRGSEPRNEASGVVLKNASVASLLISRAIAHPYFFIKDASLRSALF